MKRGLWIASTAMLSLLLLGGSALAGGWGPYFCWGREEPSAGFPEGAIDRAVDEVPEEFRDLARKAMEQVDIDFQFDYFTIGVMYDSAPARDTFLSYRGRFGLNIAKAQVTGLSNPLISSLPTDWQKFINDTVDGFLEGADDTGLGFSTKHTLVFRLISNDVFKWWAGPGIGLTANYYNQDLDISGQKVEFKAVNLSIGGGGETGVNIHLGEALTLCVGGGVHWRASGFGGGTDEVGSLVWGDGPFYFIETSLLFRTGADRG